MPHGPIRLSILVAGMALGSIGATLALAGLGVAFPVAALLSGAAAGVVQYGVLRVQPAPVRPEPPDHAGDHALERQLAEIRAYTASLRHDLRGVLSPALMMSDRLLKHADPAVQKAGHAVVRSIERATTLLADSRERMALDA